MFYISTPEKGLDLFCVTIVRYYQKKQNKIFEKGKKNILFCIKSKHQNDENICSPCQVMDLKREGNWGQSELETVLKFMMTRSLNKVNNAAKQAGFNFYNNNIIIILYNSYLFHACYIEQ